MLFEHLIYSTAIAIIAGMIWYKRRGGVAFSLSIISQNIEFRKLEIKADDPVAPQNIDAWAKKSGNKLILVRHEGNIFNILVQRT